MNAICESGVGEGREEAVRWSDEVGRRERKRGKRKREQLSRGQTGSASPVEPTSIGSMRKVMIDETRCRRVDVSDGYRS
jgi:hypothetical protein